MIFAFFSVTIIDSIIIEVLDRIERKERKLFAKVQRKLLELYTQAANHAAKMDEQAEAATSPDKMEQMMDDSLLVLDEEEADDADGADGAGGADRVYRNELHRLLSWLYRMSNHYANTRDAIIWVILVFIGVGFYMGTQKCTPARQHASTPAQQSRTTALVMLDLTARASATMFLSLPPRVSPHALGVLSRRHGFVAFHSRIVC